MKRVTVVLFLICCSVLAKSEVKFGGGGHAGIGFSSFPTGISDYFGMGYSFGGHGDLNIMKYIGIRLNADYGIYPSNKDKILQASGVPAGQATLSGLNISVLSFTLNGLGKIPTGSPATPYGIIGLGIHVANISDGTYTPNGGTAQQVKLGVASQTKFGLNFGAGSEFALGALKLFFDIKYVMIFTDGTNTGLIPLTFGVTFGE